MKSEMQAKELLETFEMTEVDLIDRSPFRCGLICLTMADVCQLVDLMVLA